MSCGTLATDPQSKRTRRVPSTVGSVSRKQSPNPTLYMRMEIPAAALSASSRAAALAGLAPAPAAPPFAWIVTVMVFSRSGSVQPGQIRAPEHAIGALVLGLV